MPNFRYAKYSSTSGTSALDNPNQLSGDDSAPGLTIAQVTSVAGITGTGNAATDYAAVVAAIAALPSTGGLIRLNGLINFGTLGPVIVDRPVMFLGSGGSDGYAATNLISGTNGTNPPVYTNESEIAATTVYNTSTTLSLFQVNANSCTFKDIHFSNRAGTEPTAGSAIVLGGASGLPSNGSIIENCSFNRFWTNIDVVNSNAYTIVKNKIIGHVAQGIRINNPENFDEGDPNICNNWIMSGKNSVRPFAGILWESGGGLRVQGNKISRKGATAAADAVRHLNGIVLRPKDGVITSVMLIQNNSIEAIDATAVLVDTSTTTGSIGLIQIQNNEFNMSPFVLSGRSENSVFRGLAGPQVPFGVMFTGNIVNGCHTMFTSNLVSGIISNNTLCGTVSGPVIKIDNGPDIGYDLNTLKLNLASPSARNNLVLLNDNTADNYNSNSQRSCYNRQYVREFPAATIGTASNLFRIQMGAGNVAATVELSFNGFLSGVGAYTSTIKRIISGNGAGVAAVATPAGWTDITLAPNATTTTFQYLTWAITNAGGYLTFAATPTAGGTPTLNNTTFAGVVSGTVRIMIDGAVREFMLF